MRDKIGEDRVFSIRFPVACLYKYLEPQWADQMLADGFLRVGTLFSYRQMEKLDPERGDLGEGTCTLHSDPSPRTYNSTSELPPVLRSMSIKVGPRGLATNGANAIVFERHSRDVFLYCVTEQFDPQLMHRFGGACVCIHNPHKFFAELDSALRNTMPNGMPLVKDGVVDRCIYAERRQNWHSPIPVPECFIKPRGYAHQREVRALWHPTQPSISPVNIQCSGILPYCERCDE
jgi:hypothetical protein